MPSAPPSTDPALAAADITPPGRPRRVAADWSVWRERLIGLAFLGAGALLWLLSGRLPALPAAVLWAALLLALALVVRQGWLPLLGPVFLYDFIRTTRRGRYAVLRLVYAAALLLLILALYRVQPALDRSLWVASAGGMTRFAENFCYTFLGAQFLTVVALTPAYVAGAVAEEKDRKTLEFLLATDVRDREIVLGKMMSRVANLALLLLTGLPILSLAQLWGGVDFGLLLCGFACAGLTLLSLAGVSMLASVYSRKPREAIVLAYLVAVGYVGISLLAHLLNFFPRVIGLPLTPGTNPYTLQDVVSVLNAGDPVVFSLGLREDLRTGVTLQESLTARTSAYAAFHLLVAAVFTGWAVLRVRPLALLDGPVRAKPRSEGRRRFGWRPHLGRRPLLWKEVWAERGLSFNWFGKAVLVLIVLASLVPAVWLIGDYCLQLAHMGAFDWEVLARSVNSWVRIVGTLVACLTLLGVAVRAASSVSGERDRQTFDSLLTCPVESNSILTAKWLGSILSVRRAWLWLCLVWALGTATDGVYLPAISWLVVAWGVYAGFLAVLGLWFSMTCRTTLRATVWTLLTAAALGVGHWYLWLLFCLPLQLREETFAWVVRFQMYGLTPPLALSWLAFRGGDVQSGVFGTAGTIEDDPMGAFYCFLVGLVVWGAAGYVLWRFACRRFRVLTGRVPIPVPAVAPAVALSLPDGPPQAEPAKRRRRRRWPVLVGAAGAVALLVVGWGVYRSTSADRHLNEALDEVDRTDPGWRLADIEAARTPILADQNSALLVLAVRGRIPGWGAWPTTDLATRLDDLPPPQRLTEGQRCGLSNDLAVVGDALALVGQLTDLPRGRYTVNWSRDYIGTLLPHLDGYHRVRQLLWYDLLWRAEEGDPDGALADCGRLVNLGRSLGDEPLMVSQQVRLLADRNAARGAQRVLAQGEPSDAALADLQRRLTDEEAHRGLVIGLRGERAGLDGLLARIEADEFLWQEVAAWAGPRQQTRQDVGEALLFSLTPGSVRESRAALLRYCTALIEAAQLPPAEQGPAFARLDAGLKEAPLVTRQLAGTGLKACNRFREGRAELRCAVAALAAERFRRQHGRWPERLDEMAPDYLDNAPTDPFDGAPLRLRRLADGLVIYSIGSDGRDDGGDVRGDANLSRAGQDVGFRLWDVSRRRQDPPP